MSAPDAFNPYAPPKSGAHDYAATPLGTTLAYRASNGFVIQNESLLPLMCVKCTRPDDLTERKQRFIYTPPWVYALLLINIIVVIVVGLIVRRKGNLTLPICRHCLSRWRAGLWIQAAAFLSVFILPFIATMLLVATSTQSEAVVGVLFGSFIAAIIGAIVVQRAVVKPRVITARFIKGDRLTLVGFHPDVEDAILVEAQGLR